MGCFPSCVARRLAERTSRVALKTRNSEVPNACLAQGRRCLTVLSMSNTITIRLPEELDQWLEKESKRTGLPKGRIVREHLELSRTRKARQPFLDLAGSVEGAPGLSRRRGFKA